MPNRRNFLTMAFGLPALGLFTSSAQAATAEVFNTDGVALHGYDVVGYFTDGKPVEGHSDYSVKWQGVMWRFASAENLETFETNPRAYAPRYGGYCAYAMSKGAIATTVPEAWSIHENRLYLNFSTGVRDIWRQDIPGNIVAADGHWPQILQA